jgi:hypothetical protein
MTWRRILAFSEVECEMGSGSRLWGEMCMKRVWIRVEKGHCLLSAKVDLMSCRGCHNPGEGKCIHQREILEVLAFVALCLFWLREQTQDLGEKVFCFQSVVEENMLSRQTQIVVLLSRFPELE